MSAPANPRASLLSGLRTGGVRSVSAQQPSTAPISPSASSFPRSATLTSLAPPNTADDGIPDGFAEAFAQMRFAQTADPRAQANALRMQQQMMYNMMGMNAGVSQEEMIYMAKVQQQQQVQLELMRLQALQQQAQAQAQILALQAQQQQVAAQAQAQQMRYHLDQSQQAASAGPYHNGSFESLRSAATSAAARRASNTAQKAMEGASEPMTAPPNGRFPSTRLNPNANVFKSSMLAQEESSPPMTAGFVSSSSTNNSTRESAATPPRKSDVATSWRRGSVTASTSASSQASSSPVRKSATPSPPLLTPTVVVSRPDEHPMTPVTPTTPVTSTRTGHRPKPLQLSGSGSNHAIANLVQADMDNEDRVTDTPSPPALSSSPTSSSPTSLSPTSAHHPVPAPAPLEASKRLYEGIGMGRPTHGGHTPNPSLSQQPSVSLTAVSRQPRGPPSGAEDLGVRNFATRIRRRAIGGLEVLKSAREGREEGVLVY